MLKQKGNKFYIGKEEVTLLAIYLPDLFLETPQDFYFYFNPNNNKFEMVSDNTFAYFASQVFYDSNFIILAKFKKSDKVELIQDKTFLFKYFSDTMDNDEDRQIFLEYGKEEIDKIHASYENMKRLLAGVGAGLFEPEQYIAQWLQKEYGEDLIFSITPNGYGYLLKIHEYNKASQYLYSFNFNKNWRKKRVTTELNNLKHDRTFLGAIRLSLESIENQKIEQIVEKAKTILTDCNIGKLSDPVRQYMNNEIIFTVLVTLDKDNHILFKFNQDLYLKQIKKSIRNKGTMEVIDGIPYTKPNEHKESFADINYKINLEETDKWLPILDNL